jgi:electron transport complex protein RnfB
MAARASSLALPAFLVAPFLARSAIQLGWCAAGTLALLIFFPSPFMTRVSDMPTEILAYLALALFAPLAALPAPGRPASAPAAKKAAPKPAATAGPAAPAFKARLKCGHGGLAPRLSRYRGLESCRIAAEHDGGPLACPYGCLALGDCVRVCPHKAVSLEGRAGASGPAFPVFDPGLCRGCGLCLSACPKNLIVLIPAASRVFVPCAAEEGLKKNAAFCDRSCLGCGRCRKACPAGAVSRPAPVGAMIINQSLCLNYAADCGQACAQSCPRHIFRPPAGRGL